MLRELREVTVSGSYNGPIIISEKFTNWMIFLIMAVIMYAVLKLIVHLINSSAERFEKNKKTSEAEVTGYSATSGGENEFDGYRLRLRVLDLDDGKEHLSSTSYWQKPTDIFPVGEIIEVEYAKNLLGWYKVYPSGVRYNTSGTAKGFNIAAKIMFCVSVFCLIGLLKVYFTS